MSQLPKEKNPPWFYYVLGLQTLIIVLVLGMLKDFMWIYQ